MSNIVMRYDQGAGEQVEREFSPLEFLTELTSHIPQFFEQTTRYFGVYSPRTRGAKAREERFQKLLLNNFEKLEEVVSSRQPSHSWARCIKLVFEINPLLSPKCGSEMKIKSFTLNSQEIERLCAHLNLQSWRPAEACLQEAKKHDPQHRRCRRSVQEGMDQLLSPGVN